MFYEWPACLALDSKTVIYFIQGCVKRLFHRPPNSYPDPFSYDKSKEFFIFKHRILLRSSINRMSVNVIYKYLLCVRFCPLFSYMSITLLLSLKIFLQSAIHGFSTGKSRLLLQS